ncbi:glucokinase [Frankia sp. AiPs1]|uniref:ROK family protein n=1 Tax=Frankia sp. AiPa1 TaxID=573492 RepID=UPI00202ADABF|nr:ROK family protein [Frankia sp. AiPa1]MCL9761124.1 ROK family protein [Frankia sp. AiPa1]
MGERALAIDIGGTKIAAAVVDADGALRGAVRRPVPVVSGPSGAEQVFAAVWDCAYESLLAAGVGIGELAGVGCGCAGPMRWPAGEVSPLNIPAWRDFPLRERLRELVDDAPVLVHNDGIALAAGEHWAGVARGVHNLLAVTVSTGVGGGLILAGQLLHGGWGNAGHIGHLTVAADGPPCPCGGQGCLEVMAAGPHTVRRALAAGWVPPAGQPADGRVLAACAAAGNQTARRELARSGSAVGAGMAAATNLLDLDAAVVAGGFAQSGPIFWDAMRAGFDRHAGLAFSRRLRILRSADPDRVPLWGAAAFVLVPDRYGWSG